MADPPFPCPSARPLCAFARAPHRSCFVLRLSFWFLPEMVETMPALWPLPRGLGAGLWAPLPVGCWLKGQFCSLVRAQGLEHPHSVTGRRELGEGGGLVRLSQREVLRESWLLEQAFWRKRCNF